MTGQSQWEMSLNKLKYITIVCILVPIVEPQLNSFQIYVSFHQNDNNNIRLIRCIVFSSSKLLRVE